MVWRDQLVTEAATGAACDVHQGDTHQSTRCRLPKHQGILKTGFQSQGITCKNKHEDQIYTGTRYLPNSTRHRRIALHKSMLPKHQRVKICEKMSQIDHRGSTLHTKYKRSSIQIDKPPMSQEQNTRGGVIGVKEGLATHQHVITQGGDTCHDHHCRRPCTIRIYHIARESKQGTCQEKLILVLKLVSSSFLPSFQTF